MRVLITDCDHGFYDPEQDVARDRGVDLQLAEGDPEAILSLGAGADALLCQYVRVDAALLDRLPGCRVIGRYGVGLDNIDLDAARERGRIVVNVPDFCVDEVADHAMALALGVTRRVALLDREWRADPAAYNAQWVDRFDVLDGVERPSKQRFGLVGFGRTGRAVAHRAAVFGFEIAAHDPFVSAGDVAAEGALALELDELLATSHVVSLHLPLTEDTARLIDAERLARMPEKSVIVNTARGALVDQDALPAALRAGRPGFAALDVFQDEPLPADSPLWDLPNAVLTPHIAFFSRTSILDLKRRAMTAVVDAAQSAAA